jgi:hypothetical protein
MACKYLTILQATYYQLITNHHALWQAYYQVRCIDARFLGSKADIC